MLDFVAQLGKDAFRNISRILTHIVDSDALAPNQPGHLGNLLQ